MTSSALNFISLKKALFVPFLIAAIFILASLLFPYKSHAAHGGEFTLAIDSISGNSVTWRVTPTPTDGAFTFVLLLKDLPVGNPDREQNISSRSTFTMTHPNGTHTAEVSVIGTDQSNDVTFTVPAAATPTPVPTTTGELDCGVKTTFATRQEWWNYSRWIRAMCDGYADQTTFSLSQFDSTVDSLGVGILGFSSIQPERNPSIAGTGALAGVGNIITVAYKDPPFSGTQYLAEQFNKLNPVQPAYAQGIGYQTLVPVQEAWTAMRNISYIGFVIVFVIIGFMIMFRSHISPQAVATVQDSLPRIVIALILVTFSYAIAGLMIDIMFLVLNVAILALPGDAGAKNIVFEKSILGVIAAGWGGTFSTAFNSIDKMFDAVFELPKFVDWIIGGLGAIIVGIAMLFIMIKILISLLISYATILILTIFSPFFFLLQALPGNNGATTWFKQMAANIAVFPTIALMIILAGYLAGIGAWGFPEGTGISSTAGNIQKFPLLAGDIPSGALGALAGIAILMMTPGAADLVKNSIGAKSQGGGAAGAAAAGALGAGAGVVGAGFRPAVAPATKFAGEAAGNRFAGSRVGSKLSTLGDKIKGKGPGT